jgi:hypothetical protein
MAGMEQQRIRRRVSQRRPPDPRYYQVLLDAHILDDTADTQVAAAVETIMGPMRMHVSVLLPHSVKAEIDHPSTPAIVKRRAADLIYAMEVSLTPAELEAHAKVRNIMRGNALSDQHDSDAFHLVEACKYGGYFVTLDKRILKKRDEVRAILPGFWPVRPHELVVIYNERVAADAASHS